MIVEPGGAARRARGKIVAAHHQRIAGGAVRAAITRAPHAPALLEDWRLRRRLEHLGISERDVVGQLFALRRKAERRDVGAAEPGAAVDEGIEHDAEELIRQLERTLLAAGRGFAGEQRQRIGEIGAGETEDVHEKKLLSALATFRWLMLKGRGAGAPPAPVPPVPPSAAVRFRIAVVGV
jgi:hypothetical protein